MYADAVGGAWTSAHGHALGQCSEPAIEYGDRLCTGAASFSRGGQYVMAKVQRTATSTPVNLLDWAGARAQRAEYGAGAVIFAQGDPATSVMYVETGAVRLSVVSHAGKEAVVAVLDVGHFFGEGCLAGQSQRIATATAMVPSTILAVEKPDMVRQLHAEPAFADRFLTHMLTRNIRIEEDLIDQLFNSSEKRLARTLLLLARYGEPEATHRVVPRVSQEVLAEMVGTTRSRVNFFMNKFRKLGLIDYNGGLKINNSLLSVVLRDGPPVKTAGGARPPSLGPVRRKTSST
jgi:CRP/FNR family cyclic AMP-dependent transcriptional regulator